MQILSILPVALAGLFTAAIPAQRIDPPALPQVGTVEPHSFAFETIANARPSIALVAEETLRFPGRSFVQIEFGNVHLPNGGFLELTSLADGQQEFMSGPDFHYRRGQTAYFNGDAVRIRMYAGPNSTGNTASTKTVSLGFADIQNPDSICGNTDDRVNSNEVRSCRILLRLSNGTSACTAWLISPTNCFATAGHCLDAGGLSLVTAQFNVPQSNSNGSINNPPISDQYAWEGFGSAQYNNGGVGNDWGVFRCLTNSVTGQHAGVVQGDYFRFGPTPAIGRPITITGNGSASGTRNLTTKTHTGPLALATSTRLCYSTDTTGGNSGSPVIDQTTNRAIGVHTHAGCDSNGGCNNGTAATRSQFAAARAQICNTNPGTYRTFGVPCFGSNGLPALSNSGLPAIGTPFSVVLNGARANSNATLLVGESDAQWDALTLPFDLSIIGAPCFLYCSGDILIPTTTNGSGQASVSITFPDNQALIGLDFYNQYIIADPFNNLGLVFTWGGAGTVGG